MKHSIQALTFVIGTAAMAGVCADTPKYKDGCSIEPLNCTMLKEDAKVRVLDYKAKAGHKVAMHTHPAHVVYVLEGGKANFTAVDGKITEVEAKPGDVFINPETVHTADYLTDIHVVIVEFKQ